MIKRKIVSVLVIVIAFLLQTTVFRELELADVVPNLLLVTTVTYAYFRGRTSGIVTGFFCGLMLDMMYGSVIGLYAFIFMTVGFIVGFCQKIYFRESLFLPAVLIAGSDLLYGLFYYITEFLMRGRIHFVFFFVHRILPEMIYTTIVGIVFFRILAFVEKIMISRRKEA
jgi:rod shape-determining protein MreD